MTKAKQGKYKRTGKSTEKNGMSYCAQVRDLALNI